MKKRVLHLLASNKFSGAENVACTIIKNTNVVSFYCSPRGPIEENLKTQEINYIPLENFNLKALKKIVKKHKIDVVHAHDFKASFIASFLPKKIKVISQLHCNYKLLKLKNIISFVYSMIQKRFDKIIVVSNEILDDARFGKKIKNKTIVLTNVVNPNKVLNLSEQSFTKKYDLIFVGRLTDVKNPLLFIDIVKDVKKEKPTIKACMVGDGDLYEKCKEEISINDLSINIELIGFKSNPFPYIKNSKLAVLTSKFEGLPMSVIECLILGVPVINSGVGGLSEMFKEHPKYICKNKNEFVDCVLDLLKLEKEDYKQDCNDLIKEYTDIKKYGQTIEKIYNEN